jgi:hypothetical protein
MVQETGALVQWWLTRGITRLEFKLEFASLSSGINNV